MDEQLVALYHRHVAAAFDRKLKLAAFVEDKAGKVKWKYEVGTAALVCGPKLKFEAPLLGSHAHGNDSWLWAWSNKNLKLTLTNRALGDLVRVTAHRIGVPMLAHPGFPLEPLLGPELTKHGAEILGCVLSRELDFDAYHIIPEDAYDSTVLVRHERLKAPEKYPLHRVMTVFPQVVAALPLFNHREALSAYAHEYGLNVTAESGTLRISDGKGELTATFDAHDRLANLGGTGFAFPPKKSKKPAPAAVVEAPPEPAKAPPAKPQAAKKVAVKPAPAKPTKKVAPKSVKKPTSRKLAAKKPTVKKVAAKSAKRPVKKR